MSAFSTASAACTALSEALSASADGVSLPIDGWKGAAADTHIEGMGSLALSLRRGADDLATAAAACDEQDSADSKLTQHPSPEEVRAAKQALEQVKVRAVAGTATPDELEDALNDYNKIRDERDAALAEHTDATSQTNIPEASSETGTDGGSLPTGETAPTDEDTDGSYGGDRGEGDGDDEAASKDASPTPSPTTPRSGDTSITSSGGGSPVADTAAPANTSLSGDNSVSTQPTTSLSASPGAQAQTATSTGGSPSMGGGGSAPVTGNGGMLSNNSQSPQRGTAAGNRQQGKGGDRDKETADQKRDLDALIAPFAAPAHSWSVPLSGSLPSTGAVSTTPSSAGATPAAGTAQPAGTAPAAGGPGGSPTATGMGSTLGSGGVLGSQSKPSEKVTAKQPSGPSQELLDRVSALLDDKGDKEKKAS